MRRDGNAKKENSERPGWLDLHPEAKRGIWGVVALGLATLFVLAFLGKAGTAGAMLERASRQFFGWGGFLLPILFLAAGLTLFLSRKARRVPLRVLLSGTGLFLSLEALLGLSSRAAAPGGMLGQALIVPSEYLFGFWASYLLWVVMFLVSAFIFMNRAPLVRREKTEALSGAEGAVSSPDIGFGKRVGQVLRPRFLFAKLTKRSPAASPDEQKTVAGESVAPKKAGTLRLGEYVPPPLNLLESGTSEPMPGDIDLNTGMIRRTLENFGILVEMAEISVGPTVTQYTLKPTEGVKLSRIVALQNDLALALAAHPLRIEAPIPGRSLVGIEIPNKVVALVRLRRLLEEVGEHARRPLSFVLGRDVTGSPVLDTLTRMPHLLIAGSTGSGKSIAIHSIITNLIYSHGPGELQLLLVDPKRVELMPYNGIPHLLSPVIVEAQKTVAALKWAISEMERRYQLLAEQGVRDIASFHGGKGELPYVVIIIDELADIMAAFGREVEAAVVRLAQMARAVGIHLIVSTQRPSVEVITGLIKANITARIAFQVASQIDSRTILDAAGAEKLLGRGDMLFLAGDGSKPRRLQGAYVSELDVKRVTDWLKKSVGTEEKTSMPWQPEPREALPAGREDRSRSLPVSFAGFERGVPNWRDPAELAGSADEPLYDEALRVVIEARRASASLLQRRLRVGYARAARLIDLMEERGMIGPGDGAKAREVLDTDERFKHEL